VRQPALFAAELFKKSLQRDSLTVLGQPRLATTPPGTVEIASYSRPIDSVLIAMNKESDNLSAENILKIIGAKQHGLPGRTRNGIYVENEFLSSFGIDTSACFIVDGSGVSHYSLLTVDNIMRLLVGMTRRPNPFHLIYASLPIAGVDGTLETRMIGTAAQGNVRGKTGTISGISSLSGYVTSRDGELLAFSMVMENFVQSTRYFQYAQDSICELLARFSRKQSATASR
jgi:D-alanyl-D-alanine carboxypeptidase/D-alanyl-D-alanine-endopeptidase (penicillin-binding protein 4)